MTTSIKTYNQIEEDNFFTSPTYISELLDCFDETTREDILREINGSLTPEEREFVNLFPYRYDSIQGKGCPETGTGVKWFTPKKRLSDEDLVINWRDPEQFVGVSFNKQTAYCLLDVDAGSEYHPISQLNKIEEALKSVGINQVNWYHSSGSNGWHGYIPFDHTIPTWGAASVLAQTLTEAGFNIAKGQLEVFPNLKTWGSKYNSHRLPLQSGFECPKEDVSYFLNDWKEAADTNNAQVFFNKIDEARAWVKSQQLSRIKDETNTGKTVKNFIPLKSLKPDVKSRAAIWYENLQKTVKTGWTGAGQTNDILGDLAALHRVFSKAESVEVLAKMIEQSAISLPGYSKYCDHTANITKRAEDWAKSAWKKYKPFGSCTHKTYEKKAPEENKNLLKAEESKSKILRAIENLLDRGEKVTQRALAKEAGISINTVIKHKDLLTQDSQESDSTSSYLIVKRCETPDQSIDHPQEKSLTTVHKISNAIEAIIREEHSLTISHIAKVSGCSRNTIKQYKHLIP